METQQPEKSIISFKGRNGRVELYENFIRLDRGTVLGFLMQGLKGKKDIYFHNITSIQIKKPGFTVGYLQLSLPGGNESIKGVFSSVKDENTITFSNKSSYEEALKIKEYIEKKIMTKNSGETGQTSVADEIEKLYLLKKKGILTQEEFEEKKKRLLGS